MNRINAMDFRTALRLAAVLLPQLAMTAHAQTTGWVQWPTASGGNGHWYKVISDQNGMNWEQASTAALRVGGYLATITSAQENSFVSSLCPLENLGLWELWSGVSFGPWIGGSAPSPRANALTGWSWVTGEQWSYSNWHPGEPSNGGGTENKLQFVWHPFIRVYPFAWNDRNPWPVGSSGEAGNVWAAVVERNTTPSTLSGKVLFSDYVGVRPGSALVEFRRPGSTAATFSQLIQLASDGSFAVDAPEAAIWDVSIKVQHWLRRTQRLNLQSNLSGTQYRLINGDVDGDNLVSILDYLDLSAAYESVPGGAGWDLDADLDGDGQVSISDYLILSTNYERSGDD